MNIHCLMDNDMNIYQNFGCQMCSTVYVSNKWVDENYNIGIAPLGWAG